MRKINSLEIVLGILLFLGYTLLIKNSNTIKEHTKVLKDKDKQIKILKEKIEQDSIHIEMLEYNYNLVFEENNVK